MKKLVYILPVFLFVLVCAGCKKDSSQNLVLEWFTECTTDEKENTFCNYIYEPVCWDDWQTYWNVCVACSSNNINSYKVWECDCDKEDWICSISDEMWNEVIEEWEISEQEDIPEIFIDVPLPNFS